LREGISILSNNLLTGIPQTLREHRPIEGA
jgi:hypothetical protein